MAEASSSEQVLEESPAVESVVEEASAEVPSEWAAFEAAVDESLNVPPVAPLGNCHVMQHWMRYLRIWTGEPAPSRVWRSAMLW